MQQIFFFIYKLYKIWHNTTRQECFKCNRQQVDTNTTILNRYRIHSFLMLICYHKLQLPLSSNKKASSDRQQQQQHQQQGTSHWSVLLFLGQPSFLLPVRVHVHSSLKMCVSLTLSNCCVHLCLQSTILSSKLYVFSSSHFFTCLMAI